MIAWKVAGEVQVHVFHRHDLGVTTARSATLHAEVRAQATLRGYRLRLLADAVQTVTQTDCRGRLTFACWRWIDRSHEDQLAAVVLLNAIDKGLG